MPIGRYFRALTAYDLLGNLVPGVLMTVVLMGFLPSPPTPATLGGYALFAVIAFTIGSVLQAHASEAVGTRDSFEKTITGAESLPSLSQSTDDGDTERKGEDGPGRFWRWVHPLLGPLIGWRRPARGDKLNDAILANRIWEHLIDTHELPFRTDSYDVLYHLMSSRVDDVRSPSRATRLQAIRNFNRGMWITSWYSTLLIAVAGVGDSLFETGARIPVLGVPYQPSAYFSTLLPISHLLVISGMGIAVFWLIFESTEDDYLEYLFVDYAIAIGDEGTELRLPEDAGVTVSGEVDANVRTEPETDEEGEEAG